MLEECHASEGMNHKRYLGAVCVSGKNYSLSGVRVGKVFISLSPAVGAWG